MDPTLVIGKPISLASSSTGGSGTVSAISSALAVEVFWSSSPLTTRTANMTTTIASMPAAPSSA